jgi:hypothetical protein
MSRLGALLKPQYVRFLFVLTDKAENAVTQGSSILQSMGEESAQPLKKKEKQQMKRELLLQSSCPTAISLLR